jgi:tetratricopeptide (TPR) repeat protein
VSDEADHLTKEHERAAAAAAQALKLDQSNALLHQRAFCALSMLGRFADAEYHSEEALKNSPASPAAHYNFGLARLRSGDFRQGWEHFGWHEYIYRSASLPRFPHWRGQCLAGRTMLLIGEQGLGDQIQMLRIASWMKRQGACVDVCVGAPLWELARTAAGVHAAWNAAPGISYDYWCRMFSAPQYMRLDISMLPIEMPYLFASTERIEYWRTRISSLSKVFHPCRKRRIGVVWTGNPTNQIDVYRSMPLHELEPLLAEFDVIWFGLQKGIDRSDSPAPPKKLTMHFLGAEIDGLDDTLAILHELDLLISVDTSAVHLAGAAGFPVWVLVPACTDWRWMLERNDTPWYPSVRIFRQRELARWNDVFAELRSALTRFVDDAP